MPADTAALLRQYLNPHAVKGSGIELPDGVEDQRRMPQRNADAFARVVAQTVGGGAGSGNGDVVKRNTGSAALVVTFSGDGWSRLMAVRGGVAGLEGRTNVGVALTPAQCLRVGMVGSWFAALFDRYDPHAKRCPCTWAG